MYLICFKKPTNSKVITRSSPIQSVTSAVYHALRILYDPIEVSCRTRIALGGVSVLWMKKQGRLDYSIPQRLVTFTSMKITRATMIKVISAAMNSPTPNSWPT